MQVKVKVNIDGVVTRWQGEYADVWDALEDGHARVVARCGLAAPVYSMSARRAEPEVLRVGDEDDGSPG
jgi:hypothetical protein